MFINDILCNLQYICQIIFLFFINFSVKSCISRRSDFAQLVRQAYLQHFDFSSLTLDVALRQFLTHLVLSGETQERERILAEFSRRFVECNPHIFGSQGNKRIAFYAFMTYTPNDYEHFLKLFLSVCIMS